MNLGILLTRAARSYPERIAIAHGTSAYCTYGELARQCVVKFDAQDIEGRVLMVFAGFIHQLGRIAATDRLCLPASVAEAAARRRIGRAGNLAPQYDALTFLIPSEIEHRFGRQ